VRGKMQKGGPVEEFNTNVSDKEARKNARRRRVAKRNAVESRVLEDEVALQAGVSKTGMQQVGDSLLTLDRRKHAALQEVTSVRVKTDVNEAKRRIEDDDMRRDRLGKLQQEAFSSAKANAAVEMKWAELLEKEIPQELHRDIQVQMDACAAIIKSKDVLIVEFQRQLRSKDEEYVRTLRQQAEDVEDLLARIRKEFKELQVVRISVCVCVCVYVYI